LWWQCLCSDCGSSIGAVITAMSTVLCTECGGDGVGAIIAVAASVQ